MKKQNDFLIIQDWIFTLFIIFILLGVIVVAIIEVITLEYHPSHEIECYDKYGNEILNTTCKTRSCEAGVISDLIGIEC